MLDGYRDPKRYPPLLAESEEEDNMEAGRGHSEVLHKGAAAVFIMWPEHATSCVLIASLTGLGLLLFAVLAVILTCESVALPRCLAEASTDVPIHNCVLGSLDLDRLPLIAQIASSYPRKRIRIIVLTENNTQALENSTMIAYYLTEFSKHKLNGYRDLNASEGYKQLTDEFQNVAIVIKTPTQYFQKSILHSQWNQLDDSGLILACKALAVWNYGGTAINVDINLLKYTNMTHHNKTTQMQKNKRSVTMNTTPISTPLKNYVNISWENTFAITEKSTTVLNTSTATSEQSFSEVAEHSEDGVTSARAEGTVRFNYSNFIVPEAEDENVILDGDGDLLATKGPCHAFTWEVLFTARVGAKNAKDIVKTALKTFCRGRSVKECRDIQWANVL